MNTESSPVALADLVADGVAQDRRCHRDSPDDPDVGVVGARQRRGRDEDRLAGQHEAEEQRVLAEHKQELDQVDDAFRHTPITALPGPIRT
jgi:hypothetical protein